MSSTDSLPLAIVAESDDETRLLVKSLLEFLGFGVIEVENAQDALEAAVGYQPELLVIELKLPIVSSFTAIRRIRRISQLSTVPIIAVSSSSTKTNQNVALAAGCSAHVQKPIEFDQLESVVETLVPCDRLAAVSLLVH